MSSILTGWFIFLLESSDWLFIHLFDIIMYELDWMIDFYGMSTRLVQFIPGR